MSNWYQRWKEEHPQGAAMFEDRMKYTLKIDDNEVGSSDSREEAESLYQSVMDEMNAGRQVGTELALWASERLIRTFTSL